MIADAYAFWFSKDGTTLPDTIKDFKHFFMRHPHLRAHEMLKWIVKTTALTHCGAIGVHRISRLDSCPTTTDTKRFQINHYITQNLPFWRDLKITRGDVHERVKNSVRDV